MIEVTLKKSFAVPSGTMKVDDSAENFTCEFGFYGEQAVKFTSVEGMVGESFVCGHYDTAERTKEIVEKFNSELKLGKKKFVMPKS